MLDKTLGYILCCQSPGLFLAAAVLVVAYFAGRRKHRFKAVLKLLLGIVCAVGITGSTGNSTGPHLHYEVMINGVNQNPLDYLPGYIARW